MDPYKVLGIGESATQEQIRAAYLALVKKYHPDRYQDNPLKDLAGEKLKEVNQAYELLAKKSVVADRGSPDKTASAGAYRRPTAASAGAKREYSGAYQAAFIRARHFINQNNLSGARAVLDAIAEHNAEWYYLSGIIFLRQGSYEKARDSIAKAYALEPNHSEYRNAYLSLKNTVNPYDRGNTGVFRRKRKGRASLFSKLFPSGK